MKPPPWWLGVGVLLWIGAWIGAIAWITGSLWSVVCR